MSVSKPKFLMLEHVIAMTVGLLLAAAGWWIASEPIGRALWNVVGVVLVLPLAMRDNARGSTADIASYACATLPMFIATAIASGFSAALVVASVAFSLLGMLALLVRIGIPTGFAIGLLLVQGVLFLTWPVWAAHLLLKFDSQWLVDLLVKIDPIFAINGSIDPTDAITHRPLAYRLMNLGQDIPYTMPRSVWPCMIVHVAAGLPGLLLHLRTRLTSSASPSPA